MRRQWQRFLCILLLLCWQNAFATALISEADIRYWAEEMRALTEDVGSRAIDTDGGELALWHVLDRFKQLGYSHQNQNLKEQWIGNASNLTATLSAQADHPAIVIISAHYDSFDGSPGAKDNASGVAAMLTLCKLFTQKGPFPNTELRFLAFTAEESGHYGSLEYTAALTEDEISRLIGVFNLDLLAVDQGAQGIALSCNTLGGRTESSYVQGTPQQPAHNAVSRSFEKALWESGSFAPSQRDQEFCVPRHFGESDHQSFHLIGVDAANICFQGNVAQGGAWPADMHSPDDRMKPFDLPRTQLALEIVYRAVSLLAEDGNPVH